MVSPVHKKGAVLVKKKRTWTTMLALSLLVLATFALLGSECAFLNPTLTIAFHGDTPTTLQCDEETCLCTVEVLIESDYKLGPAEYSDKREGAGEAVALDSHTPLGERDSEGSKYVYAMVITITPGVHTITFSAGFEGKTYVSSNKLSFTVTCECPGNCEAQARPKIKWNPRNPPPSSTDQDQVVLDILADRLLQNLLITRNQVQQTIPAGQAVLDPNAPDQYAFNYQHTQDLAEGENQLQVKGQDPDGQSDPIEHVVQKQLPGLPLIYWAQEPPTQVTNCVEGTCQVTLLISSSQPLTQITSQVDEETPQVLQNPEPNEQGYYPVTVTLRRGTNGVSITGSNENGTALNGLSCIIECVCPTSNPTIGWAQQPPEQVTNCVGGVCQVDLLVSSDQLLSRIILQVNQEEPQTLDSPPPDANGDYPVQATLQPGENTVSITGHAQTEAPGAGPTRSMDGVSNTLTCTILCMCGAPPGMEFVLEKTVGTGNVQQPVDIARSTADGHAVDVLSIVPSSMVRQIYYVPIAGETVLKTEDNLGSGCGFNGVAPWEQGGNVAQANLYGLIFDILGAMTNPFSFNNNWTAVAGAIFFDYAQRFLWTLTAQALPGGARDGEQKQLEMRDLDNWDDVPTTIPMDPLAIDITRVPNQGAPSRSGQRVPGIGIAALSDNTIQTFDAEGNAQ
ncbi:MAG TPA: hypothetical protein P5560_13495, partial [Thermotogota bacterium]|nr:hypothetical protein [Thermotogota bacterium]